MSAFGPSVGISRDLRQVAQIERDLNGRLIPRASIEQLKSKATRHDSALAQSRNDFSLYESRVKQRESQLQTLDRVDVDGKTLKQILESLEEITPVIERLLLLAPEKLLEQKEQVKHQVKRSLNICKGRMESAAQGIQRLSTLINAELAQRAETLKLWEDQEQREKAVKDSDQDATALRKEKALHDLDEENRLKAISEEQAKKKLAEDAINSQLKKERDEGKENLMLKGYLQLPQTPLKTAVLKGLTPLLRAKFLVLEIQNEWANKKTELREARNQLVQAKLKIVNEQDRLSEETDDLFLEESDLLAELKIQNRIFSDKYVRVDAEFEELDGNLNAAKRLVQELGRLEVQSKPGEPGTRIGSESTGATLALRV